MTRRITLKEARLRIRNSQSLEELSDFVKRLHLPHVSFVEIREPYKKVRPTFVVLAALVERTMELLETHRFHRE
jgi:hypothetical protein